MGIIIKPAFFHCLRAIDYVLGAHITLYCIVVLIHWSSYQPKLYECNPIDALILGWVNGQYLSAPSPASNQLYFLFLLLTLIWEVGSDLSLSEAQYAYIYSIPFLLFLSLLFPPFSFTVSGL